MVASKVQPPSPTPLPSIFGGFVDVRSLVDINLLALLHQSLLVENNDLRTMVLDTMYVLMTRSAVPVTDSPLIAMRREAFTEHSLQGYQQVLDQIFSTMVVSSTGHLDINRDTYGVGKKFVMVPPAPSKNTNNSTSAPSHPPSYSPSTANPSLHSPPSSTCSSNSAPPPPSGSQSKPSPSGATFSSPQTVSLPPQPTSAPSSNSA